MTADWVVVTKVTLKLYRDCAAKAFRGVYFNWEIVLGSAVLGFLLIAAQFVTMPLQQSMVGGFVMGLIGAALLSVYYSWISDTVRRDKVRVKTLPRFEWELFSCILSVGFILFIIDLILQQLLQNLNALPVRLGWGLIVAVLFNPVCEVIISHRFEGSRALSHAARFIMENWVEWFLPLIFFLLPSFFFSGMLALVELLSFSPLFPPSTLVAPWVTFGMVTFSLTKVLALLLGLLAAAWCMLFRAHLFMELDTSTRRRRIYQAR